jgi:hypothetical protein
LGELEPETGQKDQIIKYLKKVGNNFKEMGMDYWWEMTKKISFVNNLHISNLEK